MNPIVEAPAPGQPSLPLYLAAEVQDHLLTASNDLDRLHSLLDDACQSLAASFLGASANVEALLSSGASAAGEVAQHLGRAVTALQFQDMAAQLIAHTHRRLRNCADRLAAETFGDDEDGAGVIVAAPPRPNPVTQDEMDAGSIELF